MKKERAIRSDNTSGVKGVRWNKRANSWVATVYVKNMAVHVGYFKDLDQAKQKVENDASNEPTNP